MKRLVQYALAGLIVTAPWSTAEVASAADNPARPATTKPLVEKSAAEKPVGPKPAPAAKPLGKPGPAPLTSDLLDDGSAGNLDDQLLDDGGPTKRPTKKPPVAAPPTDKPDHPAPANDADPEPTLSRELSPDANPLIRIGEQMRAVERRLQKLRSGDGDTGELQDEIVSELGQLIRQLEEQQASSQPSKSSQQPQPSSASQRKSVRQPGAGAPNTPGQRRPSKESSERTDKPERIPPTADQLRGLMKDVWGQLPAREREQMLQSPPEQFLPKYELLLEKYYKRLADEQKHRP
jgi:hypothetical protein